MKDRIVLYPDYMETFKCIGSDCEDTCCAGWTVTVDKNTYKKYRNVKNSQLTEQFKKNLKRNKKNPSDSNYSTIKLDSENRCPFLNKDSLCSVQSLLGEDYLSHTCKIYPRSYVLVDHVIEKAATLSCPEVARQALLNKNGIVFTQTVEQSQNFGVSQTINTHSNNVKKKYFNSIRQFSIRTIQNRSFTLDERLIILGIVINKIQNIINGTSKGDIIENLSIFENSFQNVETTKADIAALPEQIKHLHIMICHIILDFRIKMGLSNHRYVECFEEMQQGLDFNEDVEIEKVGELYSKAKEKYYLPFIEKNEYLLENYFVHTMFQTAFPLRYENVFDDYVMLVIHYTLIKLHLVGMANVHEGLTVDLVLKLIQSFTKTIDHSQSYLDGVYNFLKDNDFVTMGYMAVLLKQ